MTSGQRTGRQDWPGLCINLKYDPKINGEFSSLRILPNPSATRGYLEKELDMIRQLAHLNFLTNDLSKIIDFLIK